MAFHEVSCSIESVCPLLMHNGQLADPFNEHARAMKAISAKRKKTEQDYDDLSKQEFMGSLYLNDDGRPVLPLENIQACLTNAAKRNKLGKHFKAGVFVPREAELQYDGPKAPEGLWEKKKFVDRRGVRVGSSRVIRCRPKFDKWSAKFVVAFNDEVVNREDVVVALHDAGKYVGIGDFAPVFGRFNVVGID